MKTENYLFACILSMLFVNLAYGYPPLSPYSYCAANPVNVVDPDGRDIYRFDNKTGTMVLYAKTKDKFDQIGIFKRVKDKKTGQVSYEPKEGKPGKVKTMIDEIEKGILSDGMNFKTSANVIETGNPGQPTIDGFQDFIIQFADMIGREMSGLYFTPTGSDQIRYIHIGSYENNKHNHSTPNPPYPTVRPDLLGHIEPHTAWHTHPSISPYSDRTQPSGEDIKYKNSQVDNGVKQFIILTDGYSPIVY